MILKIYLLFCKFDTLSAGREMLIDGKEYRSIWFDENDNAIVRVIDQQRLPFFHDEELSSVEDVYNAIRDMTVRGLH
jgi:hypothetical protein